MFALLTSTPTALTRRSNRRRQRHGLSIESLEGRELMTANVYIDFDGASQAEIEEVCGRVDRCSGDLDTMWDGTVSYLRGFVQGIETLDSHYWAEDGRNFTYEDFSFADFNNDNTINHADALLGISKIVERVRQDFAPYDVRVVSEPSSAAALSAMEANPAGDALIFVSGAFQGRAGAWGGQAPLDPANRGDDAGNIGETWAIAHGIYNATWLDGSLRPSDMADAFLNVFANLISHEVGHTFGLEHIMVDGLSYPPETDPRGRSIMLHAIGNRNEAFADQTYRVDDDAVRWQNEHQYLTTSVGRSQSAWAAVLKPGTLSVQGSAGADRWTASMSSSGNWSVIDSVAGRIYVVDPAAQPHPWDWRIALPDFASINQYGVPVSSIHFLGGDGDDRLSLTSSITARLIAHGQNGRDWISGGAGDDSLYGGAGNDRLYGNGGLDFVYGETGNDLLFGGASNDWLDGGSGNDVLRGQSGLDRLLGQTGRDLLIGDTGADWLEGGEDDDLLIAGTFHGSTARVMREWTRTDASYNTRIAHLRGTPGGRNGSTFLTTATVQVDDSAADELFGGGGLDWFWGLATEPRDRGWAEYLN